MDDLAKLFRVPESALKQAKLEYTTVYNVLMDIQSEGVAFRLPEYQRQSVWTEEMEIRFMESLLMQLPIGVYCVDVDYNQSPILELLDGQQRWRAIINYAADKFPVFGIKYSELSMLEKQHFHRTPFPRYVTNELPEAEKRHIFTCLAYGGVANSPDDPTTLTDRL